MTRPGYSAISSYSRVRILRLLQERSGRTIVELCEATGLHPNTVREHLQRLIAGGYVVPQVERRATRGGRACSTARRARMRSRAPSRCGARRRRHSAATSCVASCPGRMPRPRSSPGGRAPARRARGRSRPRRFDPEVDEVALTVDLSPCPHASSLPEHRDTLCSVHLGLMDGVLAHAGGPLRVEGMAPSCDPERCVVHLSR